VALTVMLKNDSFAGTPPRHVGLAGGGNCCAYHAALGVSGVASPAAAANANAATAQLRNRICDTCAESAAGREVVSSAHW
jgi:hypothetical protein